MTVRLPIALAATAALVALSGCGSSAKTSSNAAAGASTPKSGSTSSHAASQAKSTGGGSGHSINICDLMPPATVAQITGEPITVAKEDDTPSYQLYVCNYTSADGTSGLVINVLTKDAAIAYDADVQAAGAGSHPISGLGDKASSSILGLEAMYGNVVITVSNLQSDDAAESLIRALQPKLGSS